jgi:Protein of unknown function (DUF1670).
MTAELMEDYAFAAAIARSLKDFFLAYFNTYLGSDRSDGQLLYRAIPADVPPGIEVAKIKTLPVRLTLFDPSDLEVIINGTVYLQRHRIIRITNEAYDQGGVLTQADLSLLLGESLRTISTRIAELKNEGIIVPTRGNKKDIGPGISHKVTIVELYLKGHDFTDIKRRTRHSSESISRYLNDFARVACLAERQHTMGETRIITGHSEHLIQQYLDLKASLVDEETIGRYNQLTARFAGEKKDPHMQNEEIISAKSSRRDTMNVSAMLRTKVESSLETRIVNLIDQDYAMIAGDKIRQMFAKDLVTIVREEYREMDSLEVGQVLWMGVHKDDWPSYGKNAGNTQLVPIALSLISREDIDMMTEGYSEREIREKRIVRLFTEAYQQDSLLSNADVSILLRVSPTTVSKHSREFMEREKVVIPTRGTIHDLGMAMTHKKIIIKLFLEGHLTPAIARITNHSEAAVDRYIRAFEKVNLLKNEAVEYIHMATGMSRWLIESYLAIIREYTHDGDET